jgi:hypothetical protein
MEDDQLKSRQANPNRESSPDARSCRVNAMLPIRSPGYPSETPVNNLWLAMLDRMGAPPESFSDSTGLLSGSW